MLFELNDGYFKRSRFFIRNDLFSSNVFIIFFIWDDYGCNGGKIVCFVSVEWRWLFKRISVVYEIICIW